MASISITMDPSKRDDLVAARELLDTLMTGLTRVKGGERAEEKSGDRNSAATFVDELWSRIGKNLRLLAIAAATFDSDFTLVDLSESLKGVANALGEDLGHEPTLERVKGQWNGQLVPTASRVAESVVGAPAFKEDAFNDGHLWHFVIDPDVRDAIREQELAAPYFKEKSE